MEQEVSGQLLDSSSLEFWRNTTDGMHLLLLYALAV